MNERREPSGIDWSLTTWDGSRREQLEHWATLSLDQILDWQEEMAELSSDLARQRENATTIEWVAAPHVAERPSPYGGSSYDLALSGCTPEPLMAYLKALGILRLVSEQKDEHARGWWQNDVFWLRSALDVNALSSFFLEEYAPTPVVAPWAGGSGFFGRDNREAVTALRDSTFPRVSLYSRVIRSVEAIITDEGIGQKPRDEEKARLIRRYRCELPDEVIAWMDAAMVLHEDGQNFAPLLGTGGNDGRLDFTQNFMQRIVSLGLHKKPPVDEKPHRWLEHAVFATPAPLDKASVGQFAPGRAGGPNATQGMEGNSTDNPWDFVLMIEGTLLFAGAAARRLASGEASRAAFPFTVRSVAAGFRSAAPNDEIESRGELWLPLWRRPTGIGELRRLFGEGRSEACRRIAQNGTDFARAVVELGVDRGITAFSRTAFLRRSGKAFLATPIGRFEVVDRSAANLLHEVDVWLDRFRSACSSMDTPPGLRLARIKIDSAIFDLCNYGGAQLFQEILIAVGSAERALASAERFRENKKLRPISNLSSLWVTSSDDQSVEFAIARALASLHDSEMRVARFRTNLEPVVISRTQSGEHYASWAEKNRGVVWSGADLPTNLSSVLERRLLDASRTGVSDLTLASRFGVSLEALSAFMSGVVDDDRIEQLIWGLMLVDHWNSARREDIRVGTLLLPRAYALLKLLFLPRPLVIERCENGRLNARLLRDRERGGILVRPESSILNLLRGGRIGDACVVAMRRLRASGLDPMPRPVRGRSIRDRDWRELDEMGNNVVDPKRLASALLIPISDDGLGRLVRLVLCGGENVPHAAEIDAALNIEGEAAS